MKKLTASIIAGALMISAMGINAFADGAGTQPSIKVYGKAVPTSDTTEFTVKLTDFAAVKGMKLEIASGAGLKLTGVSGDIVEAGNYKVTDNKITIVDVTNNVGTANITVKAVADTAVVDSAEITVKADLARDGKNLYTEGTYNLVNGKVAVKTAAATQKVTESKDLKEDSGYFIPFGSLGYTDSKGVFRAIPKSTIDGSFSASNFPEDITKLSYNKYKLPANKIMTFGQGESKKVNGYQFGTYALENAGTKFGTMCIAGQWTEFVEYFKNNKNMTEGEMLSAIYKAYNEKVNGHKYVNMTCNNKANTIRVYVVKNQKQMWSSNTARQFSLQITGVQREEYAAVGYALNNGNAVFSDTVQYLNNK